MGAKDVERQRLNVFPYGDDGSNCSHSWNRHSLPSRDTGQCSLWAWMNDSEAFYVLGSAVRPHPYPTIVHEFQVISENHVVKSWKRRTLGACCLCRWVVLMLSVLFHSMWLMKSQIGWRWLAGHGLGCTQPLTRCVRIVDSMKLMQSLRRMES